MAPAGHVDFAGLAQSAMSRGGLWVDPDFGPDDSSLWIDRPNRDGAIGGICGRQIGWKRITELSPKPELFIDDVEDESGDGGAEANDIMQGTLGDCYFLSSLAILCTSKGHGLVERLFVCQDYLHAGLVGCRFFKEGQWIDVAIDTYLPCDVSRTRPYPVFARNKDPNEFWMALLEKAYAKIHGSYECLDAGFMNESLVDLTGAAPGEVDIPDLFAACGNDKVSALKVLGARTFGTLLQGASNDSGNEEPLGNGLISGHAYSINQVRQISTGDVLVQLRNPWGSHEWEGAWCDSDPCWTPTLKREVGQTDKNDGMFWMSIADFAKCFTRITFCDLVPSTFTVIRAESEWTRTNGGGCPNHKTWNRNPQLLMRVYERSHVTISLNQPDTRLMFRTGELTKADFEELYGCGSGYDEAIGFTVFRGGERKMRYSKSEVIGKADYSSVRTVSTCIPDCPPGDYMVVPSTFDPKMMKFRMRFWSNNPIDLIDTKGGSEWQLYDAGADSVLTQNEPKSMPVEIVPVERVEVPSQQQSTGRLNVMTRVDPLKPQPLNLQEDMTLLAKASWKVGAPIPDVWQHGQDFLMGPENRFQKFEMVAVMRPDRTMRFARVEADYTDGTYDLCTGVTETGQLMFKSNVPANFICKFPHNGPFPVNLVNQIKMIFEVIDLDGSGAIDVDFDANSLGEFNTNIGRRALRMCEINREDIEATMAALRAIDINGDGKIQQQEVRFPQTLCCISILHFHLRPVSRISDTLNVLSSLCRGCASA